MSENQTSPARKRLVAKTLIAAIYLAIALLLVGWELQEQGNLFTEERCDIPSKETTESPLMRPLYTLLLKHETPALSSNVVTVGIESSLQMVQQNICLGRGFTAELVSTIAAQQPAVIAIDKFYGAACPADDEPTKKLRAVVSGLTMPLVVGASTMSAEAEADSACLVATPQLDLGPTVQRGLTRLNADVLRLPLKWPVLASPEEKKATIMDGFAFKTAQVAEPSILDDNLKQILNSPQQPYANVDDKLEHVSASELMCSVTDSASAKQWGLQCTGKPALPDLRGKVVVIGSESTTDYPSVLGEGMYGYILQAHYIAALLSKSYVRQISGFFLLIPLAIYFVISELLIPYMHIHHHPHKPLFHIEKPLLWTAGVFVLTWALGFLIPLAFHRLPPLGMLFGILAVFIPRMLIEGWAILNEASEERKEHIA